MSALYPSLALVTIILVLLFVVLRGAKNAGRQEVIADANKKAAEQAKAEAAIHSAPARSKSDILAVLRRHTHN